MKIKKTEKKNEGGRPEILTKELADEICSRIANGESVRKIVKDNDMPSSSSIFRWLLDKNKKWFWEQYEKARNIQAELMFEELIEIADAREKDVMRDRLRVDTRKWYLSKIVPKKFGDKLDLTTKGEKFDFNDNQIAKIAERVRRGENSDGGSPSEESPN